MVFEEDKKMKKHEFILAVIVILIGLGILLWSNKADASSVICEYGLIYTETESIETKLDIERAIKVEKISIRYDNVWTTIYPWSIDRNYISLPSSSCTYISDDVNSTKNLEWYINLLNNR